MPPKGRERKAQGASGASTPKKRAKKTTSKRQPPVTSSQALGLSTELDNAEGGTQVTDRDGLDSVMDILVDISSHLDATEHGSEVLSMEGTTANTRKSQSPSTTQQGGIEWANHVPGARPYRSDSHLTALRPSGRR